MGFTPDTQHRNLLPAHLEGAWDRAVYPGGRPAANPPDQLPSTIHEQPAWTRIIVILLSRSV